MTAIESFNFVAERYVASIVYRAIKVQNVSQFTDQKFCTLMWVTTNTVQAVNSSAWTDVYSSGCDVWCVLLGNLKASVTLLAHVWYVTYQHICLAADSRVSTGSVLKPSHVKI